MSGPVVVPPMPLRVTGWTVVPVGAIARAVAPVALADPCADGTATTDAVFPPGASPVVAARRTEREDEVADLVALLLDHADPAAGPLAARARMAEIVAVACLGDDHLWQDLRLPSRRELSALMSRWFPALAARNVRDMKWKKFLYKQLCERDEIFACRAPSCAVCGDYARCFGPEEPGQPAG